MTWGGVTSHHNESSWELLGTSEILQRFVLVPVLSKLIQKFSLLQWQLEWGHSTKLSSKPFTDLEWLRRWVSTRSNFFHMHSFQKDIVEQITDQVLWFSLQTIQLKYQFLFAFLKKPGEAKGGWRKSRAYTLHSHFVSHLGGNMTMRRPGASSNLHPTVTFALTVGDVFLISSIFIS